MELAENMRLARFQCFAEGRCQVIESDYYRDWQGALERRFVLRHHWYLEDAEE
jgi:hypothetical protein